MADFDIMYTVHRVGGDETRDDGLVKIGLRDVRTGKIVNVFLDEAEAQGIGYGDRVRMELTLLEVE